MPKETVTYLSIMLQDKLMPATVKNKALSVKEQLLLIVRFYATGSMQQVVGDIAGVHKSIVCKCVFRVSLALASIAEVYIQMPRYEELESISCKFYDIARFLKVIGAIDCTHIVILSPGGERAELYRNRKGVFSYNVHTICDDKLKIRNIVCRWPGGSHDSTIFNNSNVKESFERGQYGDYCLLGDSRYPAERYLLTPLRNPTIPGEILYNKSQQVIKCQLMQTFLRKLRLRRCLLIEDRVTTGGRKPRTGNVGRKRKKTAVYMHLSRTSSLIYLQYLCNRLIKKGRITASNKHFTSFGGQVFDSILIFLSAFLSC